MRALSWIVLAAWLGVAGWLFATSGLARVREQRARNDLPTMEARRAAAWGPEIAASLAELERVCRELRERHAPGLVELQAPAPRNVHESLAWHVLFPAAVTLSSDPRASWRVRFVPGAGWSAEPLR